MTFREFWKEFEWWVRGEIVTRGARLLMRIAAKDHYEGRLFIEACRLWATEVYKRTEAENQQRALRAEWQRKLRG